MEDPKKFRHQTNFDQTIHYTTQETQELGDKIEDEHEIIRHIFEIKEQLNNNENETETVHLLGMLSLIVQSVEDLKATYIGKTVSDLQYHWSRKVAEAAKRTTDKFKRMIKDRTSDNAALSERSKNTDPSTILDESALPSPPIDEGIAMCTIPPEEFSAFFEDLDDDGNLITSNESEKLHESQTKEPTEKKTKVKMQPTGEGSTSIIHDSPRKEKQQLAAKPTNPRNSRPSHNISEIGMIHEGHRNPPTENKRKVEGLPREHSEPFLRIKREKPSRKESNEKLTNQTNSRPSDTENSSQRLRKQRVQIDANNDIKTREENDKKNAHQRQNTGQTSQLSSPSDDAANLDGKLEISKWKLQQGYQAHERSRRNPMYIEDISKDKSTSRSSRLKNSNRSRRQR